MNEMENWQRQSIKQAANNLRMVVQGGCPPETAITLLKELCNSIGDYPNMNAMGVEQATLYTLALVIEKS